MELRLSKLVDSVMRIADVRNLDEGNPVIVTLQSELGYDTMIIASFFEPYMGRYPDNVSWVDANPISNNYKKIFKRSSKAPDTARNTHHTWTELYYYRDVFNPPQSYSDSNGRALTDDEIRAHFTASNNPHNVTASQIGALPIAGGTMTGDIVLYNSALATDNSAVPKLYVDSKAHDILVQVASVQSYAEGINDRVTTIESTTIPQLQSKDAQFTNQISDLTTRLTALETGESGESGRFTNIETRLTSVESQNLTDASRLTDLNTRVTSLESLNLNSLVTTVASHTTSIESMSLRLTSLETGESGESARFTTIENNATALTARVIALETGEAGDIKKFTHTQDVAEKIWTIIHNLNTNSISVNVYYNNSLVYPDSIDIVDANTITVSFNVNSIGKVVVIG